jgi:hypothetical protein
VRHEVQRLLGWVWCVELATFNLSQRVVAVKNSLSAGWPSPYCHVGILTYGQGFAERLDGDVCLHRRQFPGEMAIAVMQQTDDSLRVFRWRMSTSCVLFLCSRCSFPLTIKTYVLYLRLIQMFKMGA